MSHQPSPAPGPSVGRTKPLTTKAMAPPGIAQNVEEGKYQAKYKELKKKVKEIELDNDKLFYKVIAVKRNIQRMRLERAVLYERLAVLPPSPHPEGNPLPPVQQPSPAAPHPGYPVDVGMNSQAHSDARERDFDEYLRAHPNANVRVIAGPDGRPIPVLAEQHPNLPPSLAGAHHPQRQRSATPPMLQIRHMSGVSVGHDSVVDRDRPPAPLSPAPESYDSRHNNTARGAHDHGQAYSSTYAQQQQQSYVRGQTPRSPPGTYAMTQQQQVTQPSRPPSTPTSPSSTRSNSHSHSRVHNHQRVGPGANMNMDEWQRQREERHREREVEREREAQRAARAGSPVTAGPAPGVSGTEARSGGILPRTSTPGASYRDSPHSDAPGDESRKRPRSAIDDGGDNGGRSARGSSSSSPASAGGIPAAMNSPGGDERSVKRVQQMHSDADVGAPTTSGGTDDKDGDPEPMDTE